MASANGSASRPIILYDLAPAPGIGANPHRVKIVLKEKGIPYQEKFIDVANKPQEFENLYRSIVANPSAKAVTPVLIDGDVKLAESHVVAEYLDTAYADKGPKLFPRDAKKLAKVRLFIDLFTNHVTPHGISIQTSTTLEELNNAKQSYVNGFKIIDTFLGEHGDKSGPFLLGNDFSYAEAASLPFLWRVSRLLPVYRKLSVLELIQQNKLHNLEKWYKAGFERESVKGTAPSDEQIVQRGKGRVKVAVDDLK